MLKLRGHHIFCLIGFRGMGYSKEYAANMAKVQEKLRAFPDTPLCLVNGADDLCAKFPCDQPYHCDTARVLEQDQRFLDKLQLQVGEVITWREIENRVQHLVTPAVIEEVCFDCQWRGYGVCEEGVQRIRQGQGLVEVKTK